MQAGSTAAGLLALMASDQLNLLIVTGSLKMKGHNDRIRGLSRTLREKKVPYKLVDGFEALDNDEYAYQMALGTLRAHPEINCIYIAAAGVAGVCRAVTELERQNQIYILSHDEIESTRQLVQDGVIDFTIGQEPKDQGYCSVCLLYTSKKVRKNYELEPAGMLWGRLAVICVAAMALSFLLGKNKGIPVVLILLGVIVLVYSYYTQNTVPGRYLYAMGGNEKAAKRSGINTNRTLFFAYTNMGFLSAVAALVCIARFNSAAPSAGTNYELDAIGACYIGGASAYGGTGRCV